MLLLASHKRELTMSNFNLEGVYQKICNRWKPKKIDLLNLTNVGEIIVGIDSCSWKCRLSSSSQSP